MLLIALGSGGLKEQGRSIALDRLQTLLSFLEDGVPLPAASLSGESDSNFHLLDQLLMQIARVSTIRYLRQATPSVGAPGGDKRALSIWHCYLKKMSRRAK